MQAAINAARGYLPANLPSNPTYRKVNPADSPIFMLALTSDTYDKGAMYDAASTIMAQKLSQLSGVGQVVVGGSSLPAVRVELNPDTVNKYGLGLEQVRTALANANANTPKGHFSNGQRSWEVGANDQIFKAVDYNQLIVSYHNGAAVRVSDVGEAVDSVEDLRNAGYANGKPSVLVIIFRQPGANIIDTVDRIRAALPQLKASIPQAIDMRVAMDQTVTIRASVHDVEVHADDFGGAGDPGGLCLPAQPADHPDPQRRRSGVADRNVRRDVPAGLQHRQSLADGADDFDGLRGGRRDCGDRKHHALSGAGDEADAGRAEGRAGDRIHGAHHQHFADRGLHSAAADGRYCGPAVPRIRGDAFDRDPRFDGGLADHHADDVRAPSQASGNARPHVPGDRARFRLGGGPLRPSAQRGAAARVRDAADPAGQRSR